MTTTEGSAPDTDEVRRRHQSVQSHGSAICRYCDDGAPFPCETIRLADALDEARADVLRQFPLSPPWSKVTEQAAEIARLRANPLADVVAVEDNNYDSGDVWGVTPDGTQP